MEYTISSLSEDAIIIQFIHDNLHEQTLEVQKAVHQISQQPFEGFLELVPAYNTITIYYNPYVIKGSLPFHTVKSQLTKILDSLNAVVVLNKRIFDIPVCYEEDFGLDLLELAANKSLTIQEIIHLHSNTVYDVVFIGFSPGFPFLSGLDQRLHYPRKTSPRLKVKQGSVGISGKQTGIYPLDTPGGWQIIGRTPVNLFDIYQSPPTLLKAGDQVKFFPISKKEFEQWESKSWK
ncbi:5-oxoprolinase subunit PxpB [Peribacillus alkalitolerans]|uniref:5-oxoprolinase subunit PxpB n=1 Tax=Peribacillus alkalitolerans TaxID=1550385 RepID=UPI0013CFB30F|nr:5-oxoprolinase subunit PxpB [Peribacillus alkalitolerans]